MSAPVQKAEIARQLGVNRVHVTHLSAEPDWPKPVERGRYLMDDVRAFLRRRAQRARPGASYCTGCGGEL